MCISSKKERIQELYEMVMEAQEIRNEMTEPKGFRREFDRIVAEMEMVLNSKPLDEERIEKILIEYYDLAILQRAVCVLVS